LFGGWNFPRNWAIGVPAEPRPPVNIEKNLVAACRQGFWLVAEREGEAKSLRRLAGKGAPCFGVYGGRGAGAGQIETTGVSVRLDWRQWRKLQPFWVPNPLSVRNPLSQQVNALGV